MSANKATGGDKGRAGMSGRAAEARKNPKPLKPDPKNVAWFPQPTASTAAVRRPRRDSARSGQVVSSPAELGRQCRTSGTQASEATTTSSSGGRAATSAGVQRRTSASAARRNESSSNSGLLRRSSTAPVCATTSTSTPLQAPSSRHCTSLPPLGPPTTSLDRQLRERLEHIRLSPGDVRQNKDVVRDIGERILQQLRENSPLLFHWDDFHSGSYYDRTKV